MSPVGAGESGLPKWRGRPLNEFLALILKRRLGDILAARKTLLGEGFVHVATGGGSGLEASRYGEFHHLSGVC